MKNNKTIRVSNSSPGYHAIGGNLCLDFANTVGGGRGHQTKEYVRDYEALIAWTKAVNIVTSAQANRLRICAEKNPGFATEVVERAHALREAIFRIVHAWNHRKEPKSEDLYLISREAAFSANRSLLTATKEGFQWNWPETDDLDRILWPIARAAIELFTSNQMELVRECDSETCTWLFLDTSKNHKRRWCVMKDCGNRAKVRRFRKSLS